MATKTKTFTSAMTGAPVLAGQAGSLIALLDAVLVNGFGSSGLVSLVVAGGVATATYASSHSFDIDTVALYAGATPAGLNGEKRILTKTANTVTFAATGIADGAATGTITSKVAPAGWTKAFSGTNKAAYKIASPEGSGFYLRVDDTGTTAARIRGYEVMTDVDTGTGAFPTVAQWAAPGLWWSKSNLASAAARPWRVYADDRGFFYFPKNYDTTSEHQANYFGDGISFKSNDPYFCLLRANITDKSASTNGSFGDDLGYSDASQSYGGLYIARAPNALGGAVQSYSASTMNVGVALAHLSGAYGFPYPSPIDNGLVLAPVVVYSTTGLRGYLPGFRFSPQIVNGSFSTGDQIDGTGDLVGKRVTAVRLGSLISSPTQCGMGFLTTTSDWR